MKIKSLLLFYLLFSQFIFADPPEPEEGEVWRINNLYSDEFNGTELDRNKWNDQFRGWQGRKPAQFVKNTISVGGGNMRIKNDVLVDNVNHTKDKYTISGGAVQSKNQTAYFGYYECNFKASRINMSTTFWLDSKAHPLESTPKQGDSFSQELDICESIGGVGNFSSDFRRKMKFNTHFRVRECGGCPMKFYSRGNNQVEIRDGELQGGDAELKTSESWEDFHTYGAYWKNASEAFFYVDNRFIRSVLFRSDVKAAPFDKPMQVNMVTETYNWATPYPTNQQLRNNNINTSYYNWIRSYELFKINEVSSVPSNTPPTGTIVSIDFENNSLAGWSKFGPAANNLSNTDTYNGSKYALQVQGANGGREYNVTVSPNTNYILKAQVKATSGGISFGIKQVGTGATTLASKVVSNTNYQETVLNFNSGTNTQLKFFLFASKATDIGFGDNFELSLADPNSSPSIPTVDANNANNAEYQFPESISLYENIKFTEDNTKIEIPYLYKTNQNNTLVATIFDSNNNKVDEVNFMVVYGYGKNKMTVALNNQLPGDNYKIVTEIKQGTTTLSSTEANVNAPVVTLGIEDSFIKASIKSQISPNPVSDILNIGESVKTKTYKVVDLNGRILKEVIANGSVNVEDLPTGIYFLTTDSGTAKFLKK